MSTAADRKMLVDYGVQIRFIKDLDDTGGGYSDKFKANGAAPAPNKYGVAVRVQGISGQPYVVLKDGEKGDSYGVQLNTPTSSTGSPSPYNSLPKPKKEPVEFTNPYGPAPTKTAARLPVSPTEEEEGEVYGSPLKRPPGDGQAGSLAEVENGKVEKHRGGVQLKATASKTETNRDGATTTEEYNEAGLRPVKINGTGPKGFKQNGPGFTGSLGRHGGNKPSTDSPSRPLPVSAAPAEVEQAPKIDTKSLAPINKLISKFDSGTPASAAPQTRGRSGARQRLRFDERRRSRSLDARKEIQPDVSLLPPPTFNPYAPSPSFSTSSSGSLGKSSAPAVAKVPAPEASKTVFASPGALAAKNFHPSIAKKPDVPLRHTSKSTEVISAEEAQVKHSVFNGLRESESEGSLRRKINSENTSSASFKKEGSDGGQQKSKLAEVQEQLERCRKDLLQAHDELAQERMSRELAESRLRLQEDQLAELQDELRRVSESAPSSDSLQTDVMTLQAELAEATLFRQRQDDTLHQRERELTALKGALKEEVECHDKEMEALREQYSLDMDNLRRTMEQFTQSQEQIEEERERVNASMMNLEEELEICKDERDQWKTELQVTTQELNNTREDLLESHVERDEFERKIRELEDSLESVKKRAPASDDNRSLAEELRRCHDNLKRTSGELDKQKKEVDEKGRELRALRESGAEKEAGLQAEVERLREQSQRDKAELERVKEQVKEEQQAEPSADPTGGKSAVDSGKSVELQEANARLRERLSRMTRLHSSVPRGADTEEAVEALEDENRSLKSQLEEAKRGVARLGKERDELTRRLEERDLERDALRRGKTDLEEQKRLLDRALEKISKEMELMMEDSRQSVASLHSQLDEYRERSRKDLLEAQRNSKDRLAELQRAQNNLKLQQEEVSRLKKELLSCSEERDSAQLERDLFSNRLKHLESELETEKNNQTDRSREIRILEDKIKTLEIELDEERSGVELLNDRVTRNRDQVDQLRSELMQERSARHDLEMDKSTLERQVKELKCRMADMEGQSRPAPGLTLLENKIQELEERLRSEEREKASIQASHRRNDRKLKEMSSTLDVERSQHVEQRDQLSLRVKALKRQVDESELEVERLEGVRRKLMRDLEEQQELQEALQAKVSALESDIKRKSQHTHRSALGSALGSSNLSSEDEDGFYDSNVTSLLHDSHLQNSSC